MASIAYPSLLTAILPASRRDGDFCASMWHAGKDEPCRMQVAMQPRSKKPRGFWGERCRRLFASGWRLYWMYIRLVMALLKMLGVCSRPHLNHYPRYRGMNGAGWKRLSDGKPLPGRSTTQILDRQSVMPISLSRTRRSMIFRRTSRSSQTGIVPPPLSLYLHSSPKCPASPVTCEGGGFFSELLLVEAEEAMATPSEPFPDSLSHEDA